MIRLLSQLPPIFALLIIKVLLDLLTRTLGQKETFPQEKDALGERHKRRPIIMHATSE